MLALSPVHWHKDTLPSLQKQSICTIAKCLNTCQSVSNIKSNSYWVGGYLFPRATAEKGTRIN